MAGRGGWGRGRGRGRGVYVRPVPFVVFPQDINLPDVQIGETDTSTKHLLKWGFDFDKYYKAAPYFLEEEATLKGRKRMHIERFSDKKETVFTRDSLPQVLVLDECVKELVPGKTKRVLIRKKREWNPEAGLAIFEKQEMELLKEGKHKKEEKDEESEDEDEDEKENEESSESDNGDYDKNEDVDDDDDESNEDAGDDEPEL